MKQTISAWQSWIGIRRDTAPRPNQVFFTHSYVGTEENKKANYPSY